MVVTAIDVFPNFSAVALSRTAIIKGREMLHCTGKQAIDARIRLTSRIAWVEKPAAIVRVMTKGPAGENGKKQVL